MILIFSNRSDHAARDSVLRAGQTDLVWSTPRELSSAGWVHQLGTRPRWQASVGAGLLDAARVRAVVTRASAVLDDDLPHIAADERGYVAMEMHAFMLGWLASLPSAVVNRPRESSLSGPAWRREQWLQLAARADIPIVQPRRNTHSDMNWLEAEPRSIHAHPWALAGRAYDAPTPELADWTLRLAEVAQLELVHARFVQRAGLGWALTAASATPALERPGVLERLLVELRGVE